MSILIWLPGIIFYFFRKESKQYRAVGFIWLTTFVILFINWHSKGEYVAASYQILFAGGAVLIEKWSTNRIWIKFATAIPVILFGIFLSPFARPLLSPETFLKYQDFVGIKPPANEGVETAMPQFYCDMFNWEKMAKTISEVYLTIPEEERSTTVVYCYNYGKAGAMEYYSKKYPLPPVLCPHNSYWYWSSDFVEPDGLNEWPVGKHITDVIVMGGEKENYLDVFEQVEQAGFYKAKYAMPYENNLKIFIGKGLKISVEEIRQEDKFFM